MVSPRLPALAVHPLLHDNPMPLIGDDEAVQIEGKSVLHCGAVDLRNEPAGRCQSGAVEACSFADRHQPGRGPPRGRAAPAADMDAELASPWRKAALQCADDAGCDARGMPV